MDQSKKAPEQVAQEASEKAANSALVATQALKELKTIVKDSGQSLINISDTISVDEEGAKGLHGFVKIGVKKDQKEDSYRLRIVKLETYITRSKWLLGVYGGLIVIMGNDIFKNREFCQRIIIGGSIVGVTLLAFAIVNFEQHLVETRRAIQTGAKEFESIGSRVKMYSQALSLLGFNVIYTLILGLLFLSFLFFKLDLRIDRNFNGEDKISMKNTSTTEPVKPDFSGSYFYVTSDKNSQCDTVVHSLKLYRDSLFELMDYCGSRVKNRYKSSSKKGMWKVDKNFNLYFICTDKTTFNVRIIADTSLKITTKSFGDSILYLYKKGSAHNYIGYPY